MLRQIGPIDFRVVSVGIALLGACTYVPPTPFTESSTGGFGGAGAGEPGSSSSGNNATAGGFAGGSGGAPVGASGVGVTSSSSSGTTGSSSSSTTSASSSGALVPPAFVQVAYTTPQTKEFSAMVAYPKAQTAGNTNILAIGWNDATSTLMNVKDTAGNTYQQAVGLSTSASMSQTIYYASNIVASPAGTNTVSVAFNAAADYIDLRIVEYSGLSHLDPVGQSTSRSGSGTLATTDTINTTTPFELLFSAGMTRGSFLNAGAGFTKRVITSPDADIVQDRIAMFPTTVKATAPSSDSEWLLQLVAFRASP